LKIPQVPLQKASSVPPAFGVLKWRSGINLNPGNGEKRKEVALRPDRKIQYSHPFLRGGRSRIPVHDRKEEGGRRGSRIVRRWPKEPAPAPSQEKKKRAVLQLRVLETRIKGTGPFVGRGEKVPTERGLPDQGHCRVMQRAIWLA